MKIQYQLPAYSQVKLRIYNLSGQVLDTIVEDNQHEGTHSFTWNGTTSDGTKVMNGTYIVALNVNGVSQSRKLILNR